MPMRDVPLRLILTVLPAFVLAAASSRPADAQQTPASQCPAGYSLTVNVCISDATGDVITPQKRKIAAERRTDR
jgi:hypothetical protein